MVLPRSKTFHNHQLINLTEILSFAIRWYTVQNVSHKGGWWFIKCNIFLAVWLSLAFKMANIKITHLYVYAACSSIIASLQWPLWLIWAGNMTGIWISSLILWCFHSVLWDLCTLQGTCGSHCQPDWVPWTKQAAPRGQVRAGTSLGVNDTRGATSLSIMSSEAVEEERHWQLLYVLSKALFTLFGEGKGDLKGIWAKFVLLMYPAPCKPHLTPVSEGTGIKPVVVKRFFC